GAQLPARITCEDSLKHSPLMQLPRQIEMMETGKDCLHDPRRTVGPVLTWNRRTHYSGKDKSGRGRAGSASTIRSFPKREGQDRFNQRRLPWEAQRRGLKPSFCRRQSSVRFVKL